MLNTKLGNLTNKQKAMQAYHSAVTDGNFAAGRCILRLIIQKSRRFYNNDADWQAGQYLEAAGLDCYTDSNGWYARYHI